jgi:hypothetical protein
MTAGAGGGASGCSGSFRRQKGSNMSKRLCPGAFAMSWAYSIGSPHFDIIRRPDGVSPNINLIDSPPVGVVWHRCSVCKRNFAYNTLRSFGLKKSGL